MEEARVEAVCVGDLVGLYVDERGGYLFSYQTSRAQKELGVGRDEGPDFPVLPNPLALAFRLQVENRYKLAKKAARLRAAMEGQPGKAAMDIKAAVGLGSAVRAAEGEARDNEAEQRRQTGRTLLYGQTLQLRHAFSRKYLHVNPVQTSATESSNMALELRAENAKTALWRILPRYKVKSEGEVVQSGDQVVFESLKSLGNFLHVSRGLFGDGYVLSDCHEANLSILSTGLTVRRYRRPEAPLKAGSEAPVEVLKGGSVVRLFHREVEGYLALEGVKREDSAPASWEPHLRVRRQDQARPKTMYPSTSAIVYWQVEKERSMADGETVHWDDWVRLRHYVRRKYLVRDREGRLGLSDDAEDPATLFALHPVLKTGEVVSADAPVRLQHAHSGAWLHGALDEPLDDLPDAFPWSTAQRRRLSFVDDMRHEDAFSLHVVDEDNCHNANFVAGTVPMLHCIGALLASSKKVSSRVLNRWEAGIRELAEFLCPEGEPVKGRQKLLRNYQMVDMAVELLRFRGRAEGRKLDGVFAALIDLLSAYLRGDSRKNELYMGRHMDFFVKQIGDASGSIGLTATLMTVELLKNNRKLVDRVTFRHIDKICTLVKQNLNFRYLDLLSALCVCDGTALSRNQNYVLQELFVKPRQKGQSVFLRTALGQAIGRRQNVVYISWDQGSHWSTLHDFAAQHSASGAFAFFREQLVLFANISAGRNAAAVSVMTGPGGCLSWEECYACLTDRKLDDSLRSIYARLLHDIFIDVGTNFVSAECRLLFDFPQVPPPSRSPVNSSSQHFPPLDLPFVEPLKVWINDFLVQNDSMVASEVGRNLLISQILVLVRQLTLLGYYADFREVKAVLDSILGLLEGSDDLPYAIQGELSDEPEAVQAMVRAYRSEGRFKDTAQNKAMAAVKVCACQATELMFDLRAENRLSRFVAEFKLVAADTAHPLQPLLQEDFDLSSEEVGRQGLRLVKQIFADSDYVGSELVSVCLDLCRYEEAVLVEESMGLVHRFHASYADLFRSARAAQLLLSDKSREVEEEVRSSLRSVRLMLADRRIDRENGRRMTVILDDLTALTYLEGDRFNDPHPINQQILCNSAVLTDLFDIVTGDIDTEPDTLKELMESCMGLLMGLAQKNPTVQGRLFDRLSDFLRNEAVAPFLAQLFGHIFQGNRALCLRVPPKVIRDIVGLLARNRSPTFLQLLSKLVVCAGEPLKRNQGLVIKALLQHKQSIDIVTESTQAQRLAVLRASEKSAEAAERKKYLSSVVDLLAHCSSGDNKAVESICQSIFTLEELLEILGLPELCNGLRAPFLRYLVAVFFNSAAAASDLESGLSELGTRPELWSFLSTITQALSNISQAVLLDPATAAKLTRARPGLIHSSREDLEHELKESLHYIFHALLPFIRIFYTEYYSGRMSSGGTEGGSSEGGARREEAGESVAGTESPEEMITRDLLHVGLLPFAEAIADALATQDQVTPCLPERLRRLEWDFEARELRRCVETVHGALEPEEALPPLGFLSLDRRDSADPLRNYLTAYREEQELNVRLCAFVDNLEAVYGGRNSVKEQLGYAIDEPYADSTDHDHPIPLGREYQSLVESFLRPDETEPDKRYANLCGVIRQVHNVLNVESRGSEREKRRQLALTQANLRVLRTLLHNREVLTRDEAGERPRKEIHRLEEELLECQRALVDMGALGALLPHLNSASELIADEVLGVLSNLLAGGSSEIQDAFMKVFESSREEPFFHCLKQRMGQSEEFLRERRVLLSARRDRAAPPTAAKDAAPTAGVLRDLEAMAARPPTDKQTVGERILKALGLVSTETSFTKTVESGFQRQRSALPSKRQDMTFARLQPDKTDLRPETTAALAWGSFLAANNLFKVSETEILSKAPRPSVFAAQGEGERDEVKEIHDPGRLRIVLQVLARLCDGQNTAMQDYLQEQHDNIRSFDLVGETCRLMGLLYGTVDAASVELLTQLVDALIEMVQGNERNQIDVFDRKVLDYVNHILRTSEFPGCSVTEVNGLRRSLGIFLTDMIEENSASQHTKTIADSIDPQELYATMDRAYRCLNVDDTAYDRDEEELILSVGFLYYHLLRRCLDLNPRLSLGEEGSLGGAAASYFAEHTMSIELAKGDTLQRVYFAVEDKEVLRESVKERLKWEVDRSTPSNKHRDFMKWATEVCADIRYQRRVQAYPLARALVSSWDALNLLVLLLAYTINLVMLLEWEAPEFYDETYRFSVAEGRFLQLTSTGIQTLEMILGVIGIFLCLALFASFLLANRPTMPPLVLSLWRRLRRRAEPPAKSLSESSDMEYLGVSLLSAASLYYFALVVLAVLGTAVNPAFFAVHTLHIASRNQLLKRVILAVTLNGRSILWVCFLGLVFFYVYALVGFLFLRNVYLGNDLYCHSMWQCFISTIRNGLMFGMADNFDVAEDDPSNSFGFYALKTIYDISFFAIIITIGLNVIFGIIIDTFSQLRESKSAIEEDMRAHCFICNLPAFEFEHHGKGFEEHVVSEHSMWAYLFFFIHLADTPPNDMTALQLYTYRAVREEGGTAFFPMARALTLAQWEEDNADQKLSQVAQQVGLLVGRVKEEAAEKERLVQQRARAAKKAARTDQKKSFWGRRKDAVLPKTRHHATYGPHSP